MCSSIAEALEHDIVNFKKYFREKGLGWSFWGGIKIPSILTKRCGISINESVE